MRVRAKAAGHVGQPITVTRSIHRKHDIVKTEVPADYILPGDEFDWDGPLGDWMEPAETPHDKKAVMAELDAAGIKYFKGATAEQLTALLPKE